MEKKAPAKKTTTKKTTAKKPVTKKTTTTKTTAAKNPAPKKTKKEQTVVLTIQATYVLKGGKMINPDYQNAPDKFPIDTIDLNVCPGADKVDIKKIQVFEKDE